jgi:Fe-S protein assembly chaperone HscA
MQIDLHLKGQQREIVAGIDLGTTNTLVAHMVDGAPRVIADREGRVMVPSVVSLDEEGHPTVGDDARDRALLNPAGTVASIKRLMGRGVADVTDAASLPYKVVRADMGEQAAVLVHGRKYLPQEISAMVLMEAKKRAERSIGARIRRAVVTVPAYFDDAQRQATRDAARIAGIDVLRILNEPTAAAVAYGLDKGKTGTVLVYDLGGGTFDVSLLRLSDGVFKVIATAGNTRLGGDDFDRLLGDFVLGGLDAAARGRLDKSPVALQAVKRAAETAKIALSSVEETTVALRFPELDIAAERRVTRSDYEAVIAPLVEETLRSVRFVLDEAELDEEDVAAVVCVGGSSRTPLVRQRLEAAFGKPPHTEIDPDQVVALGAAVQAATLAGEHEGTVLLDVTPLSLGIETYGGGVSKLIWRNSPIPFRATEGFTTYADDQTAMDMHVVQGEREMARDMRSLGKFKLRGIPRMQAGRAKVLVEFFIDADGILKVTAKEMNSGVEAGIEVKPTYGLTDEQVEDMILASIEHAEDDVREHIVADLRADGNSLIRYSEKALVAFSDKLPDAVRGGVRDAIDALRDALESADKERIETAIAVLNTNTSPIASAMMDEVLRVTVKGKTLAEVTGDKPRVAARDVRLAE